MASTDKAARVALFNCATNVVGNMVDAMDSVGYREDIAMSPDAVRQAVPFLTTLLAALADADDGSVELAREQLHTLLTLCE
jgi:hypothetical protein